MKSISVKLNFSGDFVAISFADFARHRARKLSVDLKHLVVGGGLASMQVDGPEELVDAFVEALMLGPPDCVIDAVTRQAVELKS